MAEQKPNSSSRPSPSAGDRAVENSASGQRSQEPLHNIEAAAESASERLPVCFSGDHSLSGCWQSTGPSDTCVPEPLEDAADGFGEASSVLQLEAVRPQCTEVLAPGHVEDDESAMMDALGCRAVLSRQHQQFNVDRYGGVTPHANGTYTTLTPLQPLPPISAVSERLGSGAVLMHGGNGEPHRDAGHTGLHAYSPYSYHQMKDEETMSTSFQQQQLRQLPSNSNSRIESSAFAEAQYLRYGQNLVMQQQVMCKTEFDSCGRENISQSEMAVVGSQSIYANNPMMAAMPGCGQLKSGAVTMLPSVESNTSPGGGDDICPSVGCMPSQCQVTSADQRVVLPCRASSPDQPSSSTDIRQDADYFSVSAASARHHPNDKNFSSGEEISTRDVAVRVSSELKRYSIPQAVFAQRILGRSQGTLSDLLRNPKPWSKLKSGRETFRRMWKWLQEPEYQRMAALRAGQYGFYCWIQ